MRKLEDQLVEAIGEVDLPLALERLDVLLTLDRRRAWWALFRAASQREPDSEARFTLVARTYIARRTGQLIGAKDEDVLAALAVWITAEDIDPTGNVLSDDERALLASWLPERIPHQTLVSPSSSCGSS